MDNYAEVFGALIGRARDEAVAEVAGRGGLQLDSAAAASPSAEASNVTYDEGEPDTGVFRFGSSDGFGSSFA